MNPELATTGEIIEIPTMAANFSFDLPCAINPGTSTARIERRGTTGSSPSDSTRL